MALRSNDLIISVCLSYSSREISKSIKLWEKLTKEAKYYKLDQLFFIKENRQSYMKRLNEDPCRFFFQL
jgi:hypothetical protein